MEIHDKSEKLMTIDDNVQTSMIYGNSWNSRQIDEQIIEISENQCQSMKINLNRRTFMEIHKNLRKTMTIDDNV